MSNRAYDWEAAKGVLADILPDELPEELLRTAREQSLVACDFCQRGYPLDMLTDIDNMILLCPECAAYRAQVIASGFPAQKETGDG